ncbi:lambda exonuclease family protein [Arthrobacter sp. GMC3]|uniref:lambda exonuclease family protein n=1 Tax=Arthrobacter sp. GMC3 TaxID=2058894 RepID=UPI002158617B|nr:lambda exonuclease family protein [Arthrobacter sp. GMC3]
MMIKTGARAVTPKVETPPVVVSKPKVARPAPTAPDPFDSPSYADMPKYVPPARKSELLLFEDLEQGSPEWLDARAGIVTASVVHLLLTAALKVADNKTSQGLTATLAAERITGHVEPMATSRDMERGTLDEPYARDEYSKRHAPAVELGFMVRDFGAYKIGYSPDGLVGDNGLIEIKSRKQRIQLGTFIDDDVPAENLAQIQTGLLVSGREWLDYVSYSGGMPLYVKRVYPSNAWFDVIHQAAAALEVNAADMLDKYLAATEGNPPTERIDHWEEQEIF